MNYSTIQIDIVNRVGRLTLGNGTRFNTLHHGCLKELIHAFQLFRDDPAVGCILLSGNPGESFAVGANIAEMRNFGPLDGLAFSELGQSLFGLMEECPKPIVGALNGITMGGGCDLALSCDIRIASDRLRIAHPGARLGIITGFCGTQKLPRLVGRANAFDIFSTCRELDACEALRIGLVDQVHPHAEFWEEALLFAERIAGMHPAALSYAKRLINTAEDVPVVHSAAIALGGFSALFATGQVKQRAEGILTKK